MQALILAAGLGSRLKSKTKLMVKSMIEVNEESLIERTLKQLDRLSLKQIIIVDGYLKDVFEEYVTKLNIKTPIVFISNDDYDVTNNIYSLYLAKEEFLKDDTLLIESDLIFNDTLLKKVLESDYDTIAAVSKFEPWMDGTVIEKDSENNILSFIGKDEFDFKKVTDYYKTVNMYKFSKRFINDFYIPYLEAQLKVLGKNEYYETVLKTINFIEKGNIKALDIKDEVWYEVDDLQDLDIAESLFAKDKYDKLNKIEGRYGGYWRYPKLLDFCYLVNPFYPPKKMMDEFSMSLPRLVRDYPSGLKVNTSLVAKYYDILEDNIIVGNGAAELIKALLEVNTGKIGVISPTFEEYPNRLSQGQVIKMHVNNPTFSYTAKDIIEYFTNYTISSLVLINPDNPSGNYLTKDEVVMLLDWGSKNNIQIILDESFNDFVDIEEVPSFISQNDLDSYPNLVIIKSISKSFGVPGVRLGFLCSSDKNLIKILKEKVSIWNINSFGEFFLQIFEKYKKNYQLGLEKFYTTRHNFYEELSTVPFLSIIPSQSNYFMVKLEKGSARELAADLLEKNIFIKDLTKKDGIQGRGEYLRLAVRTDEENHVLVLALKEYLL